MHRYTHRLAECCHIKSETRWNPMSHIDTTQAILSETSVAMNS